MRAAGNMLGCACVCARPRKCAGVCTRVCKVMGVRWGVHPCVQGHGSTRVCVCSQWKLVRADACACRRVGACRSVCACARVRWCVEQACKQGEQAGVCVQGQGCSGGSMRVCKQGVHVCVRGCGGTGLCVWARVHMQAGGCVKVWEHTGVHVCVHMCGHGWVHVHVCVSMLVRVCACVWVPRQGAGRRVCNCTCAHP